MTIIFQFSKLALFNRLGTGRLITTSTHEHGSLAEQNLTQRLLTEKLDTQIDAAALKLRDGFAQ